MLTQLRVTNYALIKELELNIESGFSIITGETGAGKSILLGALSLLHGQRTDTAVLKDTTAKCIVEGTFEIASYQLQHFFEENDLDWEAQTIIRREISPSGKSRAFVNDTPVNLKILRGLTNQLVDIHSQHQNIEMGRQEFQLEVLDTCTGLQSKVEIYSDKYRVWKTKSKELELLTKKAEQEKNDLDYFQFQFDQLSETNLEEGEQALLENELEQLNHAEEIQRTLGGVFQLLQEDGPSVVNQLREATNSVSRITQYLEGANEVQTRLESVWLEIKDVASDLEILANEVTYNPTRAQEINERLNTIYTLQQKHRVTSISELIELQIEFEEKIDLISNSDETIEMLQQELDVLENELRLNANDLTTKRCEEKSSIEESVNDVLHSLGMPNANFKIDIQPSEELLPHGIDLINFLFSGNKNQAFNEISKVASGGEISRLMLAIKSILAQKKSLPTIIFDEIDTGISGDVAEKMGTLLKQMANHLQIINITHLPQVAAKGDHHYWVHKEDTETETISRIKYLNKEERLLELAKMLSGENITEAALQNARSLLANN